MLLATVGHGHSFPWAAVVIILLALAAMVAVIWIDR